MTRATLAAGILLAALACGAPAEPEPNGKGRRPHRRNPEAVVKVTAVVDRAPREKRHRNGRLYEELDVVITHVLDDAPPGSQVTVDVGRRVHVAHNLSCGGVWVPLARGDRVEIRGEYVEVPDREGVDVLHFTHRATGACGRKDGHPAGYIVPR